LNLSNIWGLFEEQNINNYQS